MVITPSRRALRRLRSAAGAWGTLAVALSAPCGATDWSVTPALRLRESYSDNAQLAPPGQAHDDLITEVAPSLSLSARGARLKLDLDYTLQALHYARQPDALNHLLGASADAELLDDWLFLDARSSISRARVSAFGPQALDNLQRTDNQSSVYANRVSPFLRHRLRALATAELRYAHDTLSSGNDVLSSSSDAIALRLDGDNGGRGWNWDAQYDARRVDDNSLAPVRSKSATATLRVPATSRLNLFATAGHEDLGYSADSAGAPRGRLWRAGLDWQPSPRTSVLASGGHRFFGNTYALTARHLRHRSNWSLNYSEDITTSQSQFLRLSQNDTAAFLDQLWSAATPDPQQRQQRINTFLRLSQLLGPNAGAVNYFSHSYFLQKQLNLSVAAVTPKSTLALSASLTRRTAQTRSAFDSLLLPRIDLTLDAHTRQKGLSAGWDWRLSPRTSVSLSASYANVAALDSGRRDDNLAFSAGLSRQLRPRLTGSLELRRLRHASNLAGAGYHETGLSAALNFQL